MEKLEGGGWRQSHESQGQVGLRIKTRYGEASEQSNSQY